MNGSLTIGQKVMFGRAHGEKTMGTIVGLNGKSVKVRQDEDRGGRPVGTEWRVAPSFVHPIGGATVAAPVPQPPVVTRAPARASGWNVGDRATFTAKTGKVVTGTVTRVNTKTVTLERCDDGSRGWRVTPGMLRAPATEVAPAPAASAPRRAEDAVMQDIMNAYNDLSPENLTCDGELTRAQAAARRTVVLRRLADLQKELGRQVSEDVAWAWYGKSIVHLRLQDVQVPVPTR
jgi:ribosomal protein L35AE/L33A